MLKIITAFACATIVSLGGLSACTTLSPKLQSSEQILSEKDLERFTRWLSGQWDNIDQVNSEIKAGVPENERRARYAMRYTKMDAPAIKGTLMAIENYDDGNGFDGAMERVSLHRFMLNAPKTEIIHEILFLKDKAFRKSLINDLTPLNSITEADIRVREDCRLYWRIVEIRFEGATRQGSCVTNSYTDQMITVEGSGVLERNRLMRHDRNYEMDGDVVGSEIPRPGYQHSDVFKRISGPR